MIGKCHKIISLSSRIPDSFLGGKLTVRACRICLFCAHNNNLGFIFPVVSENDSVIHKIFAVI